MPFLLFLGAMRFVNSEDHSRSIIPLPDASLAIARPAAGRVLSEMVGETLALARREALLTSGEYVNSLWMRFVPVAGTKVLFSVWETRVQDYGVFAKETGRNLYRPSFQQESTHPVVEVSWEDAVAFCVWLSKKEGRLYRLPTDAEWSVAVGLGVENGSTPEKKALKVAGYPWGEAWPPPQGAGNYHPDLEVDDFEYTSPVGSFAANAFGLYDLGGNVWELCEDWYDDEKTTRVLRGGSWDYGDVWVLRSSFRDYDPPSDRRGDRGFRCVLVVSGG